MSLSTVYNNIDSQVTKHRVKGNIALRRELGLGPFGQPEGFFVYGRGVNEIECACDLEIRRERVRDGLGVEREVLVCLGLQFICPRCSGGLYIRGSERAITVHWDQLTRSSVDGLYRPLVSVEGSFACDYSWNEINGIAAPAGTRARNACGFRGVLDRGRLHDHELRLVVAR